ncbi:hypothetical protein O9Z70_06950 [Devosia sp. YIM 151766]|uniref:hypothetical protein n=1 Tax=Devosia sp. YIM 151766 TaxID=3017325 RepID=UPI00255C996E|nr:hypothetical protein [Devosia sp. YIM 151766]WIY54252.1 hypothetical protein O9Z70_06950 [Devosia sp. YIM 151766]
MPQSCIDPYAELDNRADAGELSEEFRKPARILLAPRRDLPHTQTGNTAIRKRNRI